MMLCVKSSIVVLIVLYLNKSQAGHCSRVSTRVNVGTALTWSSSTMHVQLNLFSLGVLMSPLRCEVFSLLQCRDFTDFFSGCIVRNKTHFCNRKGRLRLLASTSVPCCSLCTHRRKTMSRLLFSFFFTAWILALPSIFSHKLRKFYLSFPALCWQLSHCVNHPKNPPELNEEQILSIIQDCFHTHSHPSPHFLSPVIADFTPRQAVAPFCSSFCCHSTFPSCSLP